MKNFTSFLNTILKRESLLQKGPFAAFGFKLVGTARIVLFLK